MSEKISNLTVRRLRLWEIPKLLKFRSKNDYQAASDTIKQKHSPLYYVLKSIWHGNRMFTVVATEGERILGYISIVLGKLRKYKSNISIISAAVERDARGKGVGTTLFGEVDKFAASNNIRRIELEVFSKNVGAVRLYKRLGYEVEGVKRRAVESATDYDDLVIMAKLLN